MTDLEVFRVLLLEDELSYVMLLRETLEHAPHTQFKVTSADRVSVALEKLKSGSFDAILCDLIVPDSSGLETFEKLHAAAPQLPIVVLTAMENEARALTAVQRGAQDFLMKNQVDITSVARALRYAIERKKLQTQLEEALASVKTLSGLLPICASCKNIRNDHGYWVQIEAYLKDHSDASFSHGMCPNCLKKLYPDIPLAPPPQ